MAPRVRWGWGLAFAPVGVLVAALVLLIVVLLLLAPVMRDELAGSIAQFVSALAILGGALLLRGRIPDADRATTTSREASVPRTLFLGIPFGLGMVALQVVVIALGVVIDPGVQRALEDTDNQVDLNLSPVPLVITLIALAVLAPVGEELLFRSVLLRALWSRIGFWWGAVISSAAFGLAHLDPWFSGIWPRTIALAGVGLALCVVFRRWGYWTAVTAHATVNALAAIALLIAQ